MRCAAEMASEAEEENVQVVVRLRPPTSVCTTVLAARPFPLMRTPTDLREISIDIFVCEFWDGS